MVPEKIHIALVACASCGAPMHPDPSREAFSCPYCGHVVPYADHTLRGMRPLVYKHRAVPMEDGLLKLIRVAVLTGVQSDLKGHNDPSTPEARWARSFEEYVASIDRRAYVTRRDRFEFTFICSFCGGEVAGSSTQTMYECEHCGAVFGLDDLSEMGLDALPQIVGNNSMVPSKCLPYRLGSVQAQARIRYLVAQNPDLFAGHDVEGMLRALLDRMQPWDFNEAGVFIPDLVVGDVTICAATNFADKLGVINALAARTATEEIELHYGAQRLSLVRWGRDLVEHQSGLIALPVYYLEEHDGVGGGMRVMVNGQTGAVQAVVREGGVERCSGLPGSTDGRVDGERTMRSMPVPVRYERPSHLYRVLSPQEAFGWRAGRVHARD